MAAMRGRACFAYGWMRPSKLRLPDQYGGGVQVTVDMISCWMFRIERAAHAVTGGAGVGDDAEAEFFQFRQRRMIRGGVGDFGAGRS